MHLAKFIHSTSSAVGGKTLALILRCRWSGTSAGVAYCTMPISKHFCKGVVAACSCSSLSTEVSFSSGTSVSIGPSEESSLVAALVFLIIESSSTGQDVSPSRHLKLGTNCLASTNSISPGWFRSNCAITDSSSYGDMEQVLYTIKPPGLSSLKPLSAICNCNGCRPKPEAVFHLPHMFGCFRIVPSPEQGTSHNTRSKKPFFLNFERLAEDASSEGRSDTRVGKS
mmetsp:Transcript_12084/g.19661  ORF Transcript_12084/g.19661 Transcript_12084/m.19661 type:complete len:226 (-) Transcript_12084:879-1556(-)